MKKHQAFSLDLKSELPLARLILDRIIYNKEYLLIKNLLVNKTTLIIVDCKQCALWQVEESRVIQSLQDTELVHRSYKVRLYRERAIEYRVGIQRRAIEQVYRRGQRVQSWYIDLTKYGVGIQRGAIEYRVGIYTLQSTEIQGEITASTEKRNLIYKSKINQKY